MRILELARSAAWRIPVFLVLCVFIEAPAFAQGVGRFAAPLLRINPHARQVAMGEAFSALANDYNLLRYNVGGLGILRNVKLSVNYHNWIEDTRQGDVEVALPFRFGVAGVGITYFNEGDVVELNGNFQPTGNIISSNDFMLSFGYGAFIKLLGHNLAFGAGGKLIRQDLAGLSATGIGLDIGTVYAMKHLSFGATIQNFTLSKMQLGSQSELLPETVRGGVAFRLPLGEHLKWNIAGDVAKIRSEKDLRFYAGTELRFSELFSLRGGYKFHDTELNRWGAGFGLTVPMEWLANSATDIDYAFSPADQFDAMVHRFSFTFTFGAIQDVRPLNAIDAERLTQMERDLQTRLAAADAARERLEQAARDAEEQTRRLEEEMATRLEHIQQIALTSAGKIEVVPDKNDSTRILVSLRINFAFDSAVIRANEFETMNKVADILNTYPDAKLLVSGHADSIGAAEYNFKLSQRRMTSVMDYLVQNEGVRAERYFMPVAYGENRPLADNGTAEGRARNRRVEFTILTAEADPGLIEGSAIRTIQAVNDSSFALLCNGFIDTWEVRDYGMPNKLIIDFPNIFNISRQTTYEIQRGIVQRARIAYHARGNYTRVVFDTTRKPEFAIKPIADSIVILIR